MSRYRATVDVATQSQCAEWMLFGCLELVFGVGVVYEENNSEALY